VIRTCDPGTSKPTDKEPQSFYDAKLSDKQVAARMLCDTSAAHLCR